MKIGIDLDGVVINSEATLRTFYEIFDIDVLKGNNIINREEPKFQARYNWTEEQRQQFIDTYMLEASKNSPLMGGFKVVYELLKKENIEFIAITARGGYLTEMRDDAERILRENNITFDKIYWRQRDKLDTCLEENIDIMIDDDYQVVNTLSQNGIKTLYFRDSGMIKLEENEFVKEVNNWGDIYRIIKELLNKGE